MKSPRKIKSPKKVKSPKKNSPKRKSPKHYDGVQNLGNDIKKFACSIQ